MESKKYVHQDVIVSIFFIVGSVIFALQGLKVSVENLIFPTICCTTIFILSIKTLIDGIKKTKELNSKIAAGEDVQPEISWVKLKGPVVTACIALIYLLCIDTFGFFVSTAVFMPCYILLQGYRKPVPIVLVTIGVLALAVFFVLVMELNLPRGMLI